MCTFEEIKKANEAIVTTPIEKKDKKTGKVVSKEYAEVNQRIKAYRMVHPNGSILTEIVSLADGVAIFKATVKDSDGNILGTGTAYEKEGSSFINQTSYIENCETSAVGRALAMCGFGIDLSIASYEEVANAKANQEGQEVLPIINEPAEPRRRATKAAPKVEENKAEETFKEVMPPRELMIKVVKRHYPEGTEAEKAILEWLKADSIEAGSDAQLYILYNKFGGK